MIKILKHLKKLWWLVALVIALVVGKTIVDLLVPNLTSKVIALIPINGVGDKAVIIPKMLKSGLIALASVFGVLLLEFIISVVSARIASSFEGKLRQKLFDKILTLSYVDSSNYGTSSLITRTTQDVQQVGRLTAMLFRILISAPITFVGALIFTFKVNLELSYVLLCTIPILLVFIAIIGIRVLPMFKVMQKQTDNLTLVTRESITGVRVIKAFDNDILEEKRFEEKNKQITKTMTRANTIMSFAMPFVQFIMNITILGIFLVMAINLKNSTIIDPTLFANIQQVIQYIVKVMLSIIMMVMMFIMIPRGSVSANRINQILAIEPKIQDGDLKVNDNEDSTLEFKNVTFKYSGADEPAVDNLNFKANAGNTIAIIGPTGGGKSTVINLIERFLEVTDGEILLNGENIKNIELSELRRQIGYVPQVPVIFSSTILDNVKFGSNISENEVWQACDTACASEFIKNKEEGLYTELSDRGTNLSGGQKQRICIARAVARKPKILLFDDSFSALDFATDKQVRSNLKQIKNSIKIIVGQRVNTIKDADEIIVLSDGKVFGIGKHKDLIKNCEEYKLICDSQGVSK